MTTAEIANMAAEFGAAAMMGAMWLSERRSALIREKQLGETHDRILADRERLDLIVSAIENSTKAVTTLEAGQRQLLAALAKWTDQPAPSPPDPRASDAHAATSAPIIAAH